MGYFNVDLMEIEEDTCMSNFLDNITSNLLVPHIIYPTHITPTTKNLIDNIFSNTSNFEQAISCNLVIINFDHIRINKQIFTFILSNENDGITQATAKFIYNSLKLRESMKSFFLSCIITCIVSEGVGY